MDRLEGILSQLSHLDLAGEIIDKEPHASGLGGSCDVYTAHSKKHGKKVAVKQVRAFLKKDLSLAKVRLYMYRSSARDIDRKLIAEHISGSQER